MNQKRLKKGYEKYPYKKYGDDSEKSLPNRYIEEVIDYEKYPHLRYSDSDESPEPKDKHPVKRCRSETDSQDADESPASKRNNMALDNVKQPFKRMRSETPSDVSDDPPESK